MVRRYKKVKWKDERPRPAEVWGSWVAAMNPDATDKDIQAFVDACLMSAVEGQFITLEEGGYKGTCLDFILENRDRMNPYVLSQLLGFSKTWEFDPSAQLCTMDGSKIPCYGKIIDYAYEELAKDTDKKELRDQIVGYVSKKGVDLSAPLCKMNSGEAVTCMQKVLDDPKSTVAIEMKVASGQSVIPDLKGKCFTIEENAPTSCLDKIFDNMIKYGADVSNSKSVEDAKYYQSLVRVLCSRNAFSGIGSLLKENVFYDKWVEGYVSGYDKILRRLGDRGANRDALGESLKSLVDTNTVDYEWFSQSPRGCYHLFTGEPTTCLDAAFALMYDRSPESETAKKHPKSSARRFDVAERISTEASKKIKFEDQSCTTIPPPGQEWTTARTNCLSSVLAVPSDSLIVSVFDPTRLTSVVTKTCHYNAGVVGATSLSIDIPCFEAVLRTASKRMPTSRRVDYAPIIRSVVLTDGVDLSKPCNNANFTRATSCLDLLMDIDTTNAAVDHYLNGAIKAKDLSAFKCSIPRSMDVVNAFDIGMHHPNNPSAFTSKITGKTPEEASQTIEVSCLDKILTNLHAQRVMGYGVVYQGVRDPRGNRQYPPDYAKAGLTAVTRGGSTRSDSGCRYIYPDESGNPVQVTIPCYQKFIEAFMPADDPRVDGLKYRHSEPIGIDMIHEIFDNFDMTKRCTLHGIPSGVVPAGGSTNIECIAAMYMKYGADHVLFLDPSGKTRAQDTQGHSDDLRCSLIGSKHFGKVTAALKKLQEDPKYRDYIGNFKGKICNTLTCRSKPGAEDGIDSRSKGKLGKIMYCNCDEHMNPDGTFTPEAATCFEKACYSTVAKFGAGPMWDDFRRFYRAGDQTPPLVKYTQMSLRDDKKLSDDISGVYEVKPKISPFDFHVRRYITEFSKVMGRVYEIERGYPQKEKIQSINYKKLMEITGTKSIEEAIIAARSMPLTAEQMSEVDAGEVEIPIKPSISLYFKRGGARVDIPAKIVQKAASITDFIIEGKENEVYTKRPEWNPHNITGDMKAAVNAITDIAKGYVESDDRNIYIEISYKDPKGNTVQSFKFDEVYPSKKEVSLSKSQLNELKERKEIMIGDRLVKVKYALFAKQLSNSYRLSRLVEALPNLTQDVKDQIEHASKIAAGMPETPMKVVITSDPRDMMRASTCQRWGSCIKLEDGGRENTVSVATYIKSGSYIAFITDDLNNPVWKGRTLIHRSTNPKLLAVQDRWTRDCGTEYVYGMPEFRRLLLDTIRTVMHSKGYNDPVVREDAGDPPQYLWSDYMQYPAKYIAGTDMFGQVCDAFIEYYRAAGQHVSKDMCAPRDRNFNNFIAQASRAGTGVTNVDKIMQKAGIESIPTYPWLDVEHTHSNPDRRGVECGPDQEFRAISDADIAEITKYRGEDFVKPIGKYVRPYPTKEIL